MSGDAGVFIVYVFHDQCSSPSSNCRAAVPAVAALTSSDDDEDDEPPACSSFRGIGIGLLEKCMAHRSNSTLAARPSPHNNSPLLYWRYNSYVNVHGVLDDEQLTTVYLIDFANQFK